MSKLKKVLFILFGVFAFVGALFIIFLKFNNPGHLIFSDATKFADIARNLIFSKGYGLTFSFWSEGVFSLVKEALFPVSSVPPLMPMSMAGFFKIFGVSDFSVQATSFFYFILLLVFVFLLGRKIFKSNLIGILSTAAVGFNQNIIDYATSGASEIALMFEIVASAYFLTLRKKWATTIGFVLVILMYFTRPQGFIYIASMVLYWLLLKFNVKKAILYFLAVLVGGFLVDKFVLTTLSGKYFLYPILGRGLSTVNQAVVSSSTSDALRGVSASFSVVQILKKVFYDLYNFYKLLPNILSPYLFALFLIGIFKWDKKDKVGNALKASTIFMILLTLLITAVTIPFFRYLHPVVPMIYIFAVGIMVWMVNKIFQDAPKVKADRFVVLVSSFLVLFFVVGQTLGVIFLDSRFKEKITNKGKQPVYAELSYILKDNTNPSDVVVTNLDTWGSWYGERKTVWYPLEPDMLNPVSGEEVPFDAIYLTSYLIDDENYYMGVEWRQIFNNPEKITNKFVAEHYKLKGIYVVSSDKTYENMDARAVLLVRK